VECGSERVRKCHCEESFRVPEGRRGNLNDTHNTQVEIASPPSGVWKSRKDGLAMTGKKGEAM
jgi:hypothetical protein